MATVIDAKAASALLVQARSVLSSESTPSQVVIDTRGIISLGLDGTPRKDLAIDWICSLSEVGHFILRHA
jgi:hypothetical protein